MRTFTLLFAFLILLFQSCNKNKSKSKENSYYLNSEKKIAIPIDSTVSPYFSESQYLNNTNTLIIANRNKESNSLLQLSLKESKVKDKISFDSEGVNSLQGSYRNFYYHNKDSIFFINIYSNKFYITNIDGEINETIDLNQILDNDIDELGQPLLTMSSSSASFFDNIFSFVVYPLNARDMAGSSSNPALVHLDLKNRVLRKSIINYGLSTKNDLFQHPDYIKPLLESNNKGETIILFRLQNEFITLKENNIKKFSFDSDYFDEYVKMKNYDEIFSFYAESYVNDKLLFDEKNKHYYLFIGLKIPAIDENGYRNTLNDKPFSVIVFDENYNKITEKKFEGKLYNLSASFISDDNLYISLNNPLNDNFNENFFKYEVFKLDRY